MNKRMRRVISLALVLLMAVSLLTACGSESTSTHSTDNTTTDTSADTKADGGKKIAVKIAHAGTEDSLMHKAWVVAADYMEANGNLSAPFTPTARSAPTWTLRRPCRAATFRCPPAPPPT